MSEPAPGGVAGYRLSPQQRRVWALAGASAGGPYRAWAAARLEGAFDEAAIEAALAEAVARHEALRTTFSLLPGLTVPVQVVHPPGPLALERHDLSGLDPEGREREAAALPGRLWAAPLPPAEGPLVRFQVVRLAPGSFALHAVASSLCADARSLENVIGEVARGCARRAGPAPAAGPAGEAMQYPDVAEVLNDLLESPEGEAGRRHWQARRPAEAGPALPHASPGAGEAGPDGGAGGDGPEAGARAIDLDGGALEALAGRLGASPAAALLACWQALLWRLTGRLPFALGVALDGRAYEGLDEAVGPFERHVPLAVALEPGRPFAEIVAAAERELGEAYELQDYCAPPEGGAPRPAFGYGFRRAPFEAPPGASLGVEASSGRAERYDVELLAVERPGGVVASLRHDPARLPPAEAARLGARLASLLRDAAARPDAAIGSLDLLGADERRAVLVDFNPGGPPPDERCVHELFAEQARRAPRRLAASYGDDRLDYGELDARANRVAHALIALGVGPESRVGVFLERSVDAIVAIVGVLKAGGAYVPLDPLYPPERLAYMAEDAGLRALVTRGPLREALGPAGALPAVCVDELGGGAEGDPGPRARPRNAAYVIYTSGSTGRPKGVVIEHRSAAHLAAALGEAAYAGAGGPLRVSQNASLSFDASVKQWLMLLLGHSVHPVPEEVRADPGRLLAFARSEAIDVLDCTPTQLEGLLDAGLLEGPGPAMLLVGGEPIGERAWRRLAAVERPRLVNVYGPTECTVDATACVATRAPDRVTVGRPLANVRAYVLDERLAPAPLGVPGELYVGGAGVGRGYLGRPALTAGRFVPDPFGGEGGGRLYRTGDAARWLADGRLEVLGRLDDQVKVRGYRVELGEIEATLAAHPAVARAVVALRETAPGQRHLVGYFVARAGGPGGALVRELREHLRRRLPEYMVPYRLVPIERVPLSPSGKADRAALPAPPAGPEEAGAEDLPRTEVERRLAAIWQEVLRVPRVGLHQNFFDLGGHSLLMVQVFERLRAEFGGGLTMVELFHHPTVASLAERLGGGGPARALGHVDERARKQLEARQRARRGKE
ncbi:MAG TPA: amino acid adenylation domain-containing protein [Polyangiaceae bacterium]|nr:amino acid adenylation domain-containing protein [Polyangiaceae bacterium]